MPLLGNILKNAIDFTSKLRETNPEPVASQRATLRHLLGQAQDTDFGRRHDFQRLLEYPEPERVFQEVVPIFDYARMYEQYWHRLPDGEADVSWPGKPSYFALSSGTTGSEPKRLPVTEDLLATIRAAGVRQLLSLHNFDLSPVVFEKEVLMLGSSTSLVENEGWLEGEISGIGASHIPAWFDRFYQPGREVAAIEDWDERLEEIARRAPDWDIGALSGIPSWVQLMLEKVIEVHQLDTIHDLWPDLSIYTPGGVPFQPYLKSFRRLLAKPIIFMDTYLASEGFLAFNARPGTEAMQLVLDNDIFYEFLPFGPETFDGEGQPKGTVPPVPLDQLETDKDYALLISTPAGAWRYLIGDTVRFTDVDQLELVITGRTQGFLNIVGSQLSEHKLNQAIEHLSKTAGLVVREYNIGAVELAEGWAHQWYLGVEGAVEAARAAEILDGFLRDRNKAYNLARTKALKEVRVQLLPPERFYDYAGQQKKKGGQVKLPRVLLGEKWESWRAFVGED